MTWHSHVCRYWKFILLCVCFSQSYAVVHAEDVTLVENKSSPYVIHHAAEAPETARYAAKELQRLLKLSTGAELRVTSDAAVAPAIRIVSDSKLPHDGFEIRLTGRDVIIAGNDDLVPAQPDAWFVPSHGTLFGSQEFLERFVGVRWLFPGELGEDVPTHTTMSVSLKEPLAGSPSFASRMLSYVGEQDPDRPNRSKIAAIEWMKRQRLTNSMHPGVEAFGHAWDDYLTPADLEAHPEWKPAKGESVRKGKVTFFCTTAPGLVETFAQRVIASIDRYPTRAMSSISPTDGGGFCTCERCSKLITTDPYGKPSHAPAILNFYKQVAEIIQRERPGRRLGGYVYYNYQYPPADVPPLPDNLALCWAPLNYYGYGLLKPVYRTEFKDVMKRWSEVTPHFVYHNYSTWMRSFHGAPLPPSLDILQRELPAAAERHAWGARMTGTNAWGANAPVNYLIAKQLWNAKTDVSAVLDDWLQRAYGPGWQNMRQVYDELDARMLAHKAQQTPVYKGSQYEVNEDVMQEVYAPLFPAIEKGYSATLAACETDAQRQRLAMLGDNLIQLHFALRQCKLIDGDPKSHFFRDDAAYQEFLKAAESTYSLNRDGRGAFKGPIWKGEYNGP